MLNLASQIDISKALDISGWMSEKELVWLANRAKSCNRIVEFGSLHGRSTRALADNTIGIVWAVDPWNGDYINEEGNVLTTVNTFVMPQFILNMKDHIDSERVILVRGFSSTFTLPYEVDMVFIDGDHRYKIVVNDIHKALSLLRKEGLICGHDYGHSVWPGVKKAVDEILYDIKVEDTIWWTTKS